MVNMQGVSPKLRNYITMMENGLLGDILMSITPATVTQAATTSAWTRNVSIKIVNALGLIHTWLNGSYTTTLSIADAGGGTATIVSTTLTIVDGEANVVISGNAATWTAGETNTLTVGNITILGYTVTGGTSVGTFT